MPKAIEPRYKSQSFSIIEPKHGRSNSSSDAFPNNTVAIFHKNTYFVCFVQSVKKNNLCNTNLDRKIEIYALFEQKL